MNIKQQNQKTLLAKLLATEDITVIFQKVETAMFNTDTRVLIIPVFSEDYSTERLDMYITHEVGHALYTPSIKGIENELNKRPGLFNYINIVEDSRVDKLIKIKYPGVKRSYITGMKEMFEAGVFKEAVDSANKGEVNNYADKIFCLTRIADFIDIKKLILMKR